MQKAKKRLSLEVDRSPSRDEEARQFSVEFSCPTDGRPAVFWTHGSTTDRVIEFWPYCDQGPFDQMDRTRRYDLSVIRKYVVYDRASPQIRAVLLVDEPRKNDGQDVQPILGRRLEWDGPQGKAEIKKALALVDEIARIERRGRPPGISHPKQRLVCTDAGAQLYARLKKAKCTDAQIKTVFSMLRHDNVQVKAARELGVSPQAIQQRIKRIKSKIQKTPSS